jgi:hypothetical protein
MVDKMETEYEAKPAMIDGLSPAEHDWLERQSAALLKGIQAQIDILHGIRGWVIFFGILVIIGLVFSACNAILSVGR